jgi:hypothetical protein
MCYTFGIKSQFERSLEKWMNFSIYRLKHNIDENFISMEKQVWKCREKAPHMTYEDIEQFESCLVKARAYLARKEIFE